MKVYLDSSVYGGYFEPEFQTFTKELFRRIRSGWFELVFSDATDRELAPSPSNVKRLYSTYKKNGTMILVNARVAKLAKTYLLESVLPKSMLNDAVHIALATVYEIPFLVSWDKKHIVNALRIAQINIVNAENGYNNLTIITPDKLLV